MQLPDGSVWLEVVVKPAVYEGSQVNCSLGSDRMLNLSITYPSGNAHVLAKSANLGVELTLVNCAFLGRDFTCKDPAEAKFRVSLARHLLPGEQLTWEINSTAGVRAKRARLDEYYCHLLHFAVAGAGDQMSAEQPFAFDDCDN